MQQKKNSPNGVGARLEGRTNVRTVCPTRRLCPYQRLLGSERQRTTAARPRRRLVAIDGLGVSSSARLPHYFCGATRIVTQYDTLAARARACTRAKCETPSRPLCAELAN